MKMVKSSCGKALYEAPCCEILSVKAEGVLCGSINGVTIQNFSPDVEELEC